MELKLRVDAEMFKRLEVINAAMKKDCGVDVSIEAVAYRALTIGMDEMERIFEIKRPPAKGAGLRDDYEKHDQLSAKLAF